MPQSILSVLVTICCVSGVLSLCRTHEDGATKRPRAPSRRPNYFVVGLRNETITQFLWDLAGPELDEEFRIRSCLLLLKCVQKLQLLLHMS